MANNSENFNFKINSTNFTQIVHQGDSSTQEYTSEKLKGDGYYGRTDGLHTIQFSLNNFIGKIFAQATLADSPTESDWFSITSTEHISTATTENRTGSYIYNFTGNYVWIRVQIIEFTDGSITSVVLNH